MTIAYRIVLKDMYLEKVVKEKESEIKFKAEWKAVDRTATFVDGKNEIKLGEIKYEREPDVYEHSIMNWINDEKTYETGDMRFFWASTVSDEAFITTSEDFKMLEIEGYLYLYGN